MNYFACGHIVERSEDITHCEPSGGPAGGAFPGTTREHGNPTHTTLARGPNYVTHVGKFNSGASHPLEGNRDSPITTRVASK